jgi:hypothetical protein
MRPYLFLGLMSTLAACSSDASLTSSILGTSNLELVQDSVSVSTAGNDHPTNHVGMELSYYLPGSNTSLFVRRLGLTHARAFVSSIAGSGSLKSFVGSSSWGKDLAGQNVDTNGAFSAALAALSADPRGNWANPIKWDVMQNNLENNQQSIPAIAGHYLAELQAMNVQFLANLTLASPTLFELTSFDSGSSIYWGQRWEYYKYIYATSTLLMQKNVRWFETHNEPDISLPSSQDFLDRFKIASLAIRNAASDLGLSSQVHVMGPTTARSKKPIPANSYTLLAYAHNSDRFGSSSTSGWRNADALSYHRYAGDGAFFDGLAKSTRHALQSKGSTLPLFVTEYFTKTAGAFDKGSDSSNTAARAANFAAQTLSNFNNLDGFYAFTFGMRAFSGSPSGVTKNGMHFLDLSGNYRNVGHPTRSAETYRLFATNFVGTVLHDVKSRGHSGVSYLAGASQTHAYFLAANNAPNQLHVDVDLSNLGVQGGSTGILDTVSLSSHGHTDSYPKTNASGAVAYRVDGYSTSVLSIPLGNPHAKHSLPFDSANALKAGSSSDTAFANTATLPVRTSSSGNNKQTAAAALQMPKSAIGSIRKAVLQVTVQSSQSNGGLLHVYFFPTDRGNPAAMTWNNSGMLHGLADGTKVDAVQENFVNYADSSGPSFLGSFRVAGKVSNQTYSLNISDSIGSTLPGGSILIVREFNADALGGNNASVKDSLTNSEVIFYGLGATKPEYRPQLIVFTGG